MNIINLAYNPLDAPVCVETTAVTIQGFVDTRPEINAMPTICIVDGQPLMRCDWDSPICKNQIVVFQRCYGGGGGGGGKNPLLIGLIGITAFFTAGTSLAFLGATAGWQWAGAIAAGLLTSTLLLTPKIPTSATQNALAAPSPTYNLNAQGNTARIGAAIPVVYGYHQIYPDFATKPYSEYVDNEQFLNHLLVIGQGVYAISNIRIYDTSITGFDEITYEHIQPSENITLFDANVVVANEVSGQILTGEYREESYNTTCTRQVTDEHGNTITETYPCTKLHDVWYGTFVGAFVINPSETVADRFAFDFVFPRGLVTYNGTNLNNRTVDIQLWVREVNDSGVNISGWVLVETLSITAAQAEQVRQTHIIDLPSAGRYEARVKRVTGESTETTILDEVRWAACKAYLTDNTTYDGITLLAVRMKATENLSAESSRKINCTVRRKIRTWEAGGWTSIKNSQSVVWAFADAMTNTVYGAGWTDDKLDLEGFYALDQELTARGDTFNAVFDSKSTISEALNLIARAGRCAFVIEFGIMRLVRDKQQIIPKTLFNADNIVENSLHYDFAVPTDESVDGVTLEYINGDTWQPAEVSVDYDGNIPNNPASVKLFGCTNAAQAKREALYLARNNQYRRITIDLKTELNGLLPTFGGLVLLTDDIIDWGSMGGEIVDIDQQGNITMKNPIEFRDDGAYYIRFLNADGTVTNELEVIETSLGAKFADASLIFEKHTDSTTINNGTTILSVYYGSERDKTLFVFGNRTTQKPLRCIVKTIRPQGKYLVSLSLIIEDDRVHAD